MKETAFLRPIGMCSFHEGQHVGHIQATTPDPGLTSSIHKYGGGPLKSQSYEKEFEISYTRIYLHAIHVYYLRWPMGYMVVS